MANIQKDGLKYFPFEVGFFADKKIKRLRAKFGNDGICVLLYLYCQIYQEGYYIEYDDDLILDISDELNLSENLTRQIMTYLFSRSLLIHLSILTIPVTVITATSIQRRYQEAKKSLKRDVEVKAEFWVLPQSETLSFIKVLPISGKSEINADKSGIFDDKSEKNATKENKGNEIKVNKNKSIYLSEDATDAKADVVRNMVWNQIDADWLIGNGMSRGEVTEYVEIITEVLCAKNDILISGERIPITRVQGRFRALTAEHIQFVVENMENSASEIRNIKKYLITAFYNAPVTMESYYTAKVNHDLRGQK